MPSLSSLFQRSRNETTPPNGAGTGAPHQTKAFCLILGFGGKMGVLRVASPSATLSETTGISTSAGKPSFA